MNRFSKVAAASALLLAAPLAQALQIKGEWLDSRAAAKSSAITNAELQCSGRSTRIDRDEIDFESKKVGKSRFWRAHVRYECGPRR